MIRLLLAVASLAGIVSSLQCHSCDSFQSCTQPYPVMCPPHAHCYSLKRGSEVIAKGCAHNCQAIGHVEGAFCSTCNHRDFCNGDNVGIGQGIIAQHTPEIGGGVAPNIDQNYHIGGGVRPRSATHATSGLLLIIPIFRYFFL